MYENHETFWEISWGLPEIDWFYYKNEQVSLVWVIFNGLTFHNPYFHSADIHKIVDGKIKQTYHIEDWQTAAGQMLNGTPVPDFVFNWEFIDFWT